jgi:hypothetical protein
MPRPGRGASIQASCRGDLRANTVEERTMKIVVLRPRYRWVTASMLVLAVLCSALAIKDEAAAERAAPQSSINARLRPTATVNYSSSHTAEARILEAYGKLPLSFEVNQGQTDQRVKFLSRGSGYSLFLTGNEAVLTPA